MVPHGPEDRRGQWRALVHPVRQTGLIAPDRVTAPYDAALKDIGRSGRQVWAGRVLKELLSALEGERRVIVFAGREYREFLIAPMRDAGIAVDVPMAHLRQFEHDAIVQSEPVA
jgi:hypothetical protein